MYSMVLLAAMTTGTDLPDWGRRCGCYGGWGWGGGYGGWGRGYGGWGGGYGAYGWGRGYGGWGGGYGMWGGGYGGWGGGYGMGGWGGWGGYVYAPYFTGSYAAPVLASNMMPTTTPTLPTVGTRSMYYNPGVTTDNNRATIIVHLPEIAILTVNGKATASATATRRFYTPPLDAGMTYDYTFEARMDRYGRTLKVDKHVVVSAGDQKEITITLPDLNPSDPPEAPALPDDKDKKDLRDRTPPVPDRR